MVRLPRKEIVAAGSKETNGSQEPNSGSAAGFAETVTAGVSHRGSSCLLRLDACEPESKSPE